MPKIPAPPEEKLERLKEIHATAKAEGITLSAAGRAHGVSPQYLNDIRNQLERLGMWPPIPNAFPPGTKLFAGLPA